jgi:hypothetical protein
MPGNDKYIRITGRYADFLAGDITVEDLDDEEVARGRLRASDGTFRGRPPTTIPQEMVQAMKREWLSRAQARLSEALLEKGIGVLTQLAGDHTVDPAVRLRAADLIMNRTMGKVPDKIEVAAEDPVETLFRKILNDPFGLAPHEATAEERAMLG